ncbi:MAG: DUF2207 domain-containing protein [Clostridiales bacterium]|nr:DUF2207 domain-containing protein [Clostridiales bacterium]
MKNALLRSFIGGLAIVNIAFYEYIMMGFITVSDLIWGLCNFDIMAIILCVVYVIAFVIFLVHFFKRRFKNNIVAPVEVTTPDNMTPVEMGYLVDGIIDDEDLSALLVYWASKKYIEIIKVNDNQKLKKLVEKLPNECKPHETVLFNRIFKNKKEILINDVSTSLQQDGGLSVSSAINSVEKETKEKYFNQKTLRYRQLYVSIFAFLFYFSVMYFRLEYFVDVVPIVEIFAVVSSILFAVCCDWMQNYFDYRHKNNTSKGRVASIICFVLLMGLIAGLCCYFFWTDLYQVIILLCFVGILTLVGFLNRHISIYTKEGEKQLGKVLGFKNFIEVAEKDRIEMLVQENPNVFFDVLPFAYVLGVSDKWIKQFEVIEDFAKIEQQTANNVVLFVDLLSYGKINAVRTATMTKMIRSTSSSSGRRISLGRNGGSGGSRGGSNFGGFRRR